VAYPESVAEDWLEQLKLSGLKCAISPLHDKDEHSDPAVEDGKKAHWHVIVSWTGPTTYAVAKTFTEKLKATIPVKLESVKGYYRYFTHMDDPDKYQYDPTQIQHIGGFDPLEFTEITFGQRMSLTKKIEEFIDDNDIREYGRLSWSLRTAGMDDEYAVAITSTIHLNTYITSRRHELEAFEIKAKAEANE